MSVTSAHPLTAGLLTVYLDRWEDGYLQGEEFLGFLEDLAVTPAATLDQLRPGLRGNAEACLDTAVEMNLAPIARRPRVDWTLKDETPVRIEKLRGRGLLLFRLRVVHGLGDGTASYDLLDIDLTARSRVCSARPF